MSRKRKELRDQKRPVGRPRKPMPARPIEPPGPYTAPPNDGAPPVLQDYRHVWLNDASHDKTHGQKQARQLFEADIGKFNVAMMRMEDRLAARKAFGGVGEGGEDMGTQEASKLVDGLIKEFENEEHERLAKRDAELAARPNAAEIGASLQESLAGALEREKQLRKRLEELERNGSGKVGHDPARAEDHPDNASEAG